MVESTHLMGPEDIWDDYNLDGHVVTSDNKLAQ
jgi:hypothetical protein